MRVTLRKDKKSLYITAAFMLFGILLVTSVFPEVLLVYLFIATVSLFSFKFSSKHTWAADVLNIFIITVVTIYLNHFVTIYNHDFFLMYNLHSIIRFTSIQGFFSIAIELTIIPTIYLLLNALFIPRKVSAFIAPLPTLLLCLADFYVYGFRQTELTPMDFTALSAAANVAEGYSFELYEPLIFIVVPYIFLVVCLMRINPPKHNISTIKSKIIHFVSYLAASAVFFALMLLAVNGASNKFKVRAFDDTGTIHNGYITNFALEINALNVKAPDGYDKGSMAQLVNAHASNSSDDSSNIIVIMSEAYADLSIYVNQFDSYEAPDLFWRELKESNNTRSGFAYSSVFGGMTSNSEYELLTGITMSGLPEGSIPYTMYISSPTYSLPRYLNELGYNTTAMHPYYENSYNRPLTYANMGFDNMVFKDDCIYTDDDTMRVANLISDYCAYDNILSIVDSTEGKSFVFLVTIQNHGGYTDPDDTPGYRTYAEGADETVNNYLSLIKQSDIALEHLINELSNREDKYTVLIFGDHQPTLNLNPPLEAGSNAWKIPYMIWTNYDMPEGFAGSDITTSINYLSLDVMTVAGIPYSPYYEYISSIRDVVPAINSVGYYSRSENSWIPTDAAASHADEQDAINRYYALQYYTLFDN